MARVGNEFGSVTRTKTLWLVSGLNMLSSKRCAIDDDGDVLSGFETLKFVQITTTKEKKYTI
jgi:hypothetical protein